MKLHCCVAAYISDFAFLHTALLPHQHHKVSFMASLDHSMWFHAPFRADTWMLYECESPWAGTSQWGGERGTDSRLVGWSLSPSALSCGNPLFHTGGCRGLVQGRLWRRDGVLAASCAQEGVLRVPEQPPPSKL